MASFSVLVHSRRFATATTAPSTAPRTTAPAMLSFDGLAAGFLRRVRVAAARAAVLRRAAGAPFVFFVDRLAFADPLAFAVPVDRRLAAVARFANGNPP